MTTSTISDKDIAEAARMIERLTGVAPTISRKMTRKEKQRQKERVQEFLSLPVPLQEGCLKYAESIMQAYKKTSS